MPRLRLLLPALSLALHVFLSPPAHAQGQTVETTGPDISVVVDGFLQGRASYLRVASATEEADAAERLGFGFRRIRLRFDVGIGDRLGLFFHFAGASGTVGVLDFFATYQATDRLRFRFGRMASAQPRAFILTPAPAIDAVDRAFIAERWGARTLSPDGRDFGVDVQLQGERGEVSLFLHNGDGSWSAGNVRGGLSSRDPLNGLDRTGLALSLYGAYRPPTLSGLEVGAFAGVNGAKNLITVRDAGSPGRTYTSYAAHLYWGATPGSQPVRVKADVIGVRYAAPESGGDATSTLGLSLLGAAQASRGAEVFGRVESYRGEEEAFASVDNGPYWTVGASLSPSAFRGLAYARERLTLAYSTTRPDVSGAGRRHLVTLQAQIVF